VGGETSKSGKGGVGGAAKKSWETLGVEKTRSTDLFKKNRGGEVQK